MINSYSFGKIVINNRIYTSDVIIYPDRVDNGWWRKTGHLLQVDDLLSILSYSPNILIIGTGAHGLLKVPKKTKLFIQTKGIKLIIQKSGDAWKTYNGLKDKHKVIAAFHLTC